MPGVVKRVYESPDDNYYHMVIGSDDEKGTKKEDTKEFKLIKQDKYLDMKNKLQSCSF